jgi:hypothetical protein
LKGNEYSLARCIKVPDFRNDVRESGHAESPCGLLAAEAKNIKALDFHID